MNCTKQEFFDKIRAKYPQKAFECEPDIWNTNKIFALDYIGQPLSQSSHIWENGKVVYDSGDPLNPTFFTSTGPITITLPIPTSTEFHYTIHRGSNLHNANVNASPKCECGSHSVGSNKHSSYCPIKEE